MSQNDVYVHVGTTNADQYYSHHASKLVDGDIWSMFNLYRCFTYPREEDVFRIRMLLIVLQ